MSIRKKQSVFTQKVYQLVSQIPKGEVWSYQKVAQAIGHPQASRAVAKVLAQNTDSRIPCHRVVHQNGLIGGYKGGKEQIWEKAGLLLKEGVVMVLPTDTLYGLVGSALNQKVVEKIYQLKKRNLTKPMIILIDQLKWLEFFKVRFNQKQSDFLKRIWPSRISVILPCLSQGFAYLHRGTMSLAFRWPKKEELVRIISLSGPLVAPSANPEGKKPAYCIAEARRYFGNEVVYYQDEGELKEPSTLLDFRKDKPRVIRKGADFALLERVLKRIVDKSP